MPVMSQYMQRQILDWIRNQSPPLEISSQWPVADTIKPQQLELGPKEIAVLGAAAVLKKNPKIKRRFWT
jgi:hypothetical protein